MKKNIYKKIEYLLNRQYIPKKEVLVSGDENQYKTMKNICIFLKGKHFNPFVLFKQNIYDEPPIINNSIERAIFKDIGLWIRFFTIPKEPNEISKYINNTFIVQEFIRSTDEKIVIEQLKVITIYNFSAFSIEPMFIENTEYLYTLHNHTSFKITFFADMWINGSFLGSTSDFIFTKPNKLTGTLKISINYSLQSVISIENNIIVFVKNPQLKKLLITKEITEIGIFKNVGYLKIGRTWGFFNYRKMLPYKILLFFNIERKQ